MKMIFSSLSFGSTLHWSRDQHMWRYGDFRESSGTQLAPFTAFGLSTSARAHARAHTHGCSLLHFDFFPLDHCFLVEVVKQDFGACTLSSRFLVEVIQQHCSVPNWYYLAGKIIIGDCLMMSIFLIWRQWRGKWSSQCKNFLLCYVYMYLLRCGL